MRVNGVIEKSWTENTDDYFAPSKVIVKHSDIRTEGRARGDVNSIRRDKFGTIDYTYYAARAKSLHSESIISFFKALVSCLKFNN